MVLRIKRELLSIYHITAYGGIPLKAVQVKTGR